MPAIEPRSTPTKLTVQLTGDQNQTFIFDERATSAWGRFEDFSDRLTKNCSFAAGPFGSAVPPDWVQLQVPEVEGSSGIFAPPLQPVNATTLACIGATINSVSTRSTPGTGSDVGAIIGVTLGPIVVLLVGGRIWWAYQDRKDRRAADRAQHQQGSIATDGSHISLSDATSQRDGASGPPLGTATTLNEPYSPTELEAAHTSEPASNRPSEA